MVNKKKTGKRLEMTGSYLNFEKKNKWSIAGFEPEIPSMKDSMFSTVILRFLILPSRRKNYCEHDRASKYG